MRATSAAPTLRVNETLEVAKHMRFQSPQSVQALCATLDEQKDTLDSCILKDLVHYSKNAHNSDIALMREAIEKCKQMSNDVIACGTEMRRRLESAATS